MIVSSLILLKPDYFSNNPLIIKTSCPVLIAYSVSVKHYFFYTNCFEITDLILLRHKSLNNYNTFILIFFLLFLAYIIILLWKSLLLNRSTLETIILQKGGRPVLSPTSGVISVNSSLEIDIKYKSIKQCVTKNLINLNKLNLIVTKS